MNTNRSVIVIFTALVSVLLVVVLWIELPGSSMDPAAPADLSMADQLDGSGLGGGDESALSTSVRESVESEANTRGAKLPEKNGNLDAGQPGQYFLGEVVLEGVKGNRDVIVSGMGRLEGVAITDELGRYRLDAMGYSDAQLKFFKSGFVPRLLTHEAGLAQTVVLNRGPLIVASFRVAAEESGDRAWCGSVAVERKSALGKLSTIEETSTDGTLSLACAENSLLTLSPIVRQEATVKWAIEVGQTGQEIKLTIPHHEAWASVLVKSRLSDLPVPFAKVTSKGVVWGRADQNGRLQVGIGADKLVDTVFSSEGFIDQRFNARLNPGATHTVYLLKESRLQLTPVNAQGDPVRADAVLRVWRENGLLNHRGLRPARSGKVFRSAKDGMIEVTQIGTRSGVSGVELTLRPQFGAPVTIGPISISAGSTKDLGRIVLESGQRLTGSILAAPMYQLASVRCVDCDVAVRSRSDGFFKLGLKSRSEHMLEIRPEEYPFIVLMRRVDMGFADSVHVDVELPLTVSGLAVEVSLPSGEPLEGINVVAVPSSEKYRYDYSFHGVTNANGIAKLSVPTLAGAEPVGYQCQLDRWEGDLISGVLFAPNEWKVVTEGNAQVLFQLTGASGIDGGQPEVFYAPESGEGAGRWSRCIVSGGPLAGYSCHVPVGAGHVRIRLHGFRDAEFSLEVCQGQVTDLAAVTLLALGD